MLFFLAKKGLGVKILQTEINENSSKITPSVLT